MKLLNLTGRYYAFVSVGIIILGGFIAYQVQKYHINKQFNQQLLYEKEQLLVELDSYTDISETLPNVGDKIELVKKPSDFRMEEVFSDTVMYDSYAKEELLFRRLVFTSSIDGQNYKISIAKSLLSTTELISSIGEIMLILMSGLLLAFTLINRYLSRMIWGPFYTTLESIRRFNITEPLKLVKAETKVDEFNELQDAIEDIFSKSQKDYLNLKEFTENSSHELQTPLAIIKAKSELLLQSETLSEMEIAEVKGIYDAANRLSKLNQGFNLLTRIENNQFVSNSTLHISTYLTDLLSNYSELMEMQHIHLVKKFNFDPALIIDDTLAYALFSNLITNAIKHNNEEGFIEIKVNKMEVVFINSGDPIEGDSSRLFERFTKGDESNSPGLGLAIVKKICDHYNIDVAYLYADSRHKITLSI